jgi:hypothetical protein
MDKWQWVWQSNYKLVAAPMWLLTLMPICLSMAPWLRWSRRFRLRTLLIATTLVAVVLGLIVWMSRTG